MVRHLEEVQRFRADPDGIEQVGDVGQASDTGVACEEDPAIVDLELEDRARVVLCARVAQVGQRFEPERFLDPLDDGDRPPTTASNASLIRAAAGVERKSPSSDS